MPLHGRTSSWWAGPHATCCSGAHPGSSTWWWPPTLPPRPGIWPRSSGSLPQRIPTGAPVSRRTSASAPPWCGGRAGGSTSPAGAESYAGPGALPEVRAGTTEEDLRRRDFTVNAIAVLLAGPRRGELSTAPRALEDLAAARLRVLHEGSFLDDPTRLFRLARYLARLGFQAEERTAELAAEALASGALETVSRARVGAELRLALGEPDPVAAIAALSELGILPALDPRLRLDGALARGALAILPGDGRADLLLLASLLLDMAEDPEEDPERVMFGLLDDLEFTAADRARTTKTAPWGRCSSNGWRP